MNICGNVLVSEDALKFALKCLYCEINLEEWEAFVVHIQSLHHIDEEPCIDPPEHTDCKENIVIEWVKEEPFAPNKTSRKGGIAEVEVKELPEIELPPAKRDSIKIEPTDDPVANIGGPSDDYDDGEGDDDGEGEDDNEYGGKSSDMDSSDAFLSKNDTKLSNKFKPTFFKQNNNTTVLIEIFEKASCLWNPNDSNYGDRSVRAISKKQVINEMKKRCQITLNNKTLWECIRELYAKYKATAAAIEKQNVNKTKKLSAVTLEYFEKCSLLSAVKEDFLDIENAIPNTNSNLSFATLNKTTIAFIETYKRFPSLYDPKHEGFVYMLARKQTYKEMANILRDEHNIEFTDDEIYKGIFYLRHWYFKFKGRGSKKFNQKNLTSRSKFYMEKCSFLPERKTREKTTCPECGKPFQISAMKQVHMFKEHNIGELPFKCEQCNKTFASNSALKYHQNRNHMEKVHKCEFCEKCFALIADLKQHTEIHTGHKSFICELCGKGFRTKTRMGYHKNAIHIKLRAFKCTMCPKDFLKSRDLKDHIKSHLNIRDKICETCGKGFTNSHALIRHRQLHAEVKKFACKFCEKRFYQFVGLNSHMKHKHGIYKKPQKKPEKEVQSTDVVAKSNQ